MSAPGRWAVVPPLAAAILVRDHGAWLRKLEAQGQALVLSGPSETVGRHLLEMVAQVRAAGRETLSATSGVGRSEVPTRAPDAESDRPPTGLSTSEVAERFGFAGPRQVVNLIRVGRLSATRWRGRWVIDELSVVQEEQRNPRRNR